MIEICINPDKNDWNSFVLSQSSSAIFHSYEWKNVLERSFGYKPLYLACKKEGKIIAGMPLFEVSSFFTGKRLVSLPFSAVGGCLGEDGTINDFIQFIQKELNLNKYDFLQIRSDKELPINGADYAIGREFVDTEMVLGHDLERIWKEFPVNIRTSVRKAEKSGVALVKGRGAKELREFYRLNLLSRKGFGTPAFPLGYFKNILQEFTEAIIYFAVWEGNYINTILLLPWQGCFYYFYVGADIKYRDKSGSDFLVWEMIKDAVAQKITKINFGRMEQDNSSLAFFKKKWGAQEKELYYYHVPKAGFVSSRKGTAYRLVTGAFRVMPIQLAKIIGPPLTKRLG